MINRQLIDYSFVKSFSDHSSWLSINVTISLIVGEPLDSISTETRLRLQYNKSKNAEPVEPDPAYTGGGNYASK